MSCIVEIKETYSNVREFSFQTKKEANLDEEQINVFLDANNDFKVRIVNSTERLKTINDSLEKLTWFNNLNEECKMILNDIIALSKDLHSSLIRYYIQANPLRIKGIAKQEIKEFKSELDDLKESYEDLESIFFILPEMPEFKETTKLLSLV